ncbi:MULTISPECIES: SDR family oxidoreductase [unclassified Enterococcus]|uniref:SDR family oxidoreductase n=1 Tax=unclassified Enterococcus TaxID=2608891 RepID=UPI0013EACAC0|nr:MULTISPECIES: SDR family oxidoreductase [unclassified Enterococcus]
MENIKGKVVIITGASSGIGEATALLLAKEGARLVLAARREEKLKAIVEKINAGSGEAVYQVTDVTDPKDNQRLVAFAKETYGKVDVIFLNAGIMPSSPLSALKTDEWNQMVDINLKGVLNGLAAVLPEFIAQKSGHVITTSSVAGLKAYPGGAVYGATKWAVRDLMEVLRMESAQEGTNIRTATIYPAAINTELLETITDESSAEGMTALYEQYGITPDRIARIVLFAINQPADVNVSEFTVGPTTQPW